MSTRPAHRYKHEGPPGCVAMQLARGAPVKGNLPNDEEIIAEPVPHALVARPTLLAAQSVGQAPPLLVGGISFLKTFQPHKPEPLTGRQQAWAYCRRICTLSGLCKAPGKA